MNLLRKLKSRIVGVCRADDSEDIWIHVMRRNGHLCVECNRDAKDEDVIEAVKLLARTFRIGDEVGMLKWKN